MAMKKKPETYLGGMAGKAAQGLGGRRAQIDAAIDQATGARPAKKAAPMKSTPVPPRAPPRTNQRAPKYR